ncbi:hypothetical protein L7F22_047709 [Adiantum nelumboides]|nr:hypothetical protein [Adiantum nelumboides]
MTEWHQLNAATCKNLDDFNRKFWKALLPVASYKFVTLTEQIEKYCCGLPKGLRKYCVSRFSLTETRFVVTLIVHVEGKKNVVADALSRKPQISAVSIPYHHELDDMREQYANDEDFARAFEQLMDGQRHEHYLLKDGFMMMHGRLCVTRPLRRKVMKESHVPPYAGHRGIDATVKAVETFFYWPTLRRDVDVFVRECITCQKVKFDRQKAPRFSKQAHFIPVRKKIKPDQMARLFMSNIFKYHGMPQSIVSDRDPRMTSLFWRGLFENMDTTLKFSSSFHPQTDGQSEEANSTVLYLLKCYVSEHKGKWEQYLPLVEYGYNNSVHSSIGKAPFEIAEGGKKVPLILHTKDKIFEADKYVQDMDEMYKKVKVALEKTRAKQKKAADRHRREVVFSLGDWVLLRFEKARLKKMKGKERLFPKLSMRYYGPFQLPVAPAVSPAPWGSCSLNLERFRTPKLTQNSKNQQPGCAEIAPVW